VYVCSCIPSVTYTLTVSRSILFIFFPPFLLFFLFRTASPHDIYTLSLHDALPISTSIFTSGSPGKTSIPVCKGIDKSIIYIQGRSEEHTSELQSRFDLVCRLLLEKKKLTHSSNRPHNTKHSSNKTYCNITRNDNIN